MKKRFVYCNVEYAALEKEVLLNAAHMTASCGKGKISVHLADGITLERAEAPETATLNIREKTYNIIGASSFEKMMLMWKNTPTIYVLDAEVNKWKEEWKRNKHRLKELNISLVGIRELPDYPKTKTNKHESRRNATYSREYTSYQRHRQSNMSETNEVFTELSEMAACDKKKTTPDITQRNVDITWVKTLIYSLVSVGIAFYAHCGVAFPYPFWGDWFDIIISFCDIYFTLFILHVVYSITEETICTIIKPAIYKKSKAADKDLIVAKLSQVLTGILVLVFTPICVYFCI